MAVITNAQIICMPCSINGDARYTLMIAKNMLVLRVYEIYLLIHDNYSEAARGGLCFGDNAISPLSNEINIKITYDE